MGGKILATLPYKKWASPPSLLRGENHELILVGEK